LRGAWSQSLIIILSPSSTNRPPNLATPSKPKSIVSRWLSVSVEHSNPSWSGSELLPPFSLMITPSLVQKFVQPTFVRMVMVLRSFGRLFCAVSGSGGHFTVAKVDLPVTRARSDVVQFSDKSVNFSTVSSWWKVEPPMAYMIPSMTCTE